VAMGGCRSENDCGLPLYRSIGMSERWAVNDVELHSWWSCFGLEFGCGNTTQNAWISWWGLIVVESLHLGVVFGSKYLSQLEVHIPSSRVQGGLPGTRRKGRPSPMLVQHHCVNKPFNSIRKTVW
jgi:hypothetical protein